MLEIRTRNGSGKRHYESPFGRDAVEWLNYSGAGWQILIYQFQKYKACKQTSLEMLGLIDCAIAPDYRPHCCPSLSLRDNMT